MIDEQKLRDLLVQSLVPHVQRHHGDGGVASWAELNEVVREVHRVIDVPSLVGTLTIARVVDCDGANVEQGTEILNLRTLTGYATTATSVVLLRDERGRTRLLADTISAHDLSDAAVVYLRKVDGTEWLVCGGEEKEIPTPFVGRTSAFRAPVYRTLVAEINRYGRILVERSHCEILSTAWARADRIFFRPKPEEIMRRSLAQFLLGVVPADADVLPEQNVDESHPVDIRVTYNLQNRVALLEIKWLGKSLDAASRRFTAIYNDARAREGATQLAEYLDATAEFQPERIRRGYLVIFDARRWRTNENTAAVSQADGLYYQSRDIEWKDCDYHRRRSDYEEPIRLFARPQVPV